ncbi:MAG: LEA type 2 family protein [Gemmatimonadetes bacterium]|nr:LEA type 2 family protein [Gemmatimonadota bacterium]
MTLMKSLQRRPALVPLSVLAAMLMSACATLGRQAVQVPTVELRDIRIRGIGLDGGALDLVLTVHNPNEYRMDATRVTYTLVADSAVVAQGAVNRRVTLQPKAPNDVTLPVTFTFKELLGAAEILLRKGVVDYVVRGEVTSSGPFGSITRPYEGKARLDNGVLIPR